MIFYTILKLLSVDTVNIEDFYALALLAVCSIIIVQLTWLLCLCCGQDFYLYACDCFINCKPLSTTRQNIIGLALELYGYGVT